MSINGLCRRRRARGQTRKLNLKLSKAWGEKNALKQVIKHLF
jgi:hypothetical protein